MTLADSTVPYWLKNSFTSPGFEARCKGHTTTLRIAGSSLGSRKQRRRRYHSPSSPFRDSTRVLDAAASRREEIFFSSTVQFTKRKKLTHFIFGGVVRPAVFLGDTFSRKKALAWSKRYSVPKYFSSNSAAKFFPSGSFRLPSA
ncbi:hypothetical protein TcCL_NonESM02215 [Trypanosoma cruzi]|nr:hypothetical protein TcCL_NonESM02215 [Trypanosoma cruzi]